MTISRMQLPEEIDAFANGGDISSTPNSAFADLGAQMMQVPNYDESFEKYQNRLAPYAYQEPKMSVYDLASELGAGLLSTPNTGGNSAYIGLGLGFSRASDRMRAQKQKNAQARQQIAMQAAQFAMQDEQKAMDFMMQSSLKSIDNANKRADLITFEWTDAEGAVQRQSIRDNVANDEEISNLLSLGAIEVKTPGSVVNVSSGTKVGKRDEVAIDKQYKMEEQLSKDAEAAYGIVDNVNEAMRIADELGPDGFGAVESFTFYPRKVMNALGFGDLAETEKLGSQQVLNQLGMGFTMAIVSQTKGAISNKEMELFIQASPGLGSTYDGFKKQGAYLQRIAQRDIDYFEAYNIKAAELESQELAGEISASGTYRELQKLKTQWQQDNPLFSKDEISELQDMVDNKVGVDPEFDVEGYKKQFEEKRKEASEQKSNYTLNKNVNPGAQALLDLKSTINADTNLSPEQKNTLIASIDAKL